MGRSVDHFGHIWGHNPVHLADLLAIIALLSMSQVGFSMAGNVKATPLQLESFAGWATIAGFCFAYVTTWIPFASDFSRHLPRYTPHPRAKCSTAVGSFVAIIAVAVSNLPVSDMNLHYGSVSLHTIRVRSTALPA